MDPHSYANLHEIKTKALHLSLQASFEHKTLAGQVSLDCERLDTTATQVILDTRDLAIHSVKVDSQELDFSLGVASEAFGQALIIELGSSLEGSSSTQFTLVIDYATSPLASGIQWLEPNQTAGKTRPYLFTQCQAIHARSVVPCQDAPSAKVTYAAAISVPKWATCLMSAVQTTTMDSSSPVEFDALCRVQDEKKKKEKSDTTTTYYWTQRVPIPSYLLALVVGDLASVDIGPRSRVWAEPSVVHQAAYEFHQTEDFIQHAEAIMDQPYVWGRYDLVCLPPSFPYGGMENPCLTFVTPTLLTATVTRDSVTGAQEFSGGRELVDVVAHEIAHSWTGNLITNATWEHFWLNEGWTMWLQRKIMSRVHSPAYFDFDATLGTSALVESVEHYGASHDFTCLCPTLTSVDPDDAFSSIPYEKGFAFLYYLEQTIGASSFLKFAQFYCQAFKFQTVTTSEFITCFQDWCAAGSSSGLEVSVRASVEAIDFPAWISSPGLPLVSPVLDTSISQSSLDLAQEWIHRNTKNTTGTMSKAPSEFQSCVQWTSTQKVVMLEKILAAFPNATSNSPSNPPTTHPSDLCLQTLEEMEHEYALSDSRNAEIRFCWYTLCLRCKDGMFILPQVETFLKEQGRMKFIRPLYRELVWSKYGHASALEWFQDWRANYHPIAQKMLAKDLGL